MLQIHRHRLSVITATVLALVGVAWVAVAAPIVPQKQTLPGEVRSLADLTAVEASVQISHPIYEQQNYDVDSATAKVEEMLKEYGLTLSKEIGTPTIRIVLLANTSAAYPDAVSYSLHLSVEQKAKIERLDQSLYVPTYALVHGGIVKRGQLLDEIDKMLPNVVQHFLTRVDTANNVK